MSGLHLILIIKKLWNPSSSSSSFIFHPIFPNSESFIVWERNLCGTKQPWPLPVKLWRETWSSFQQQKNATETVFKTFFRSLVSVEERKILPDFEVSTWKVIFFEGKDVASEDIGASWVVLLLIKWSKKLQRDFQSVRSWSGFWFLSTWDGHQIFNPIIVFTIRPCDQYCPKRWSPQLGWIKHGNSIVLCSSLSSNSPCWEFWLGRKRTTTWTRKYFRRALSFSSTFHCWIK